jgi:hypothetical protein
VLVHAASCAQFPYFPERFRNPVHEVTLRLWAEGQAAPNPLQWLGVPGLWSLLPYALAVTLAVALAAHAALTSWRPILLSALLATLLLAALGRAPHSGPTGEAGFQWIRSAMTGDHNAR